MTELHWLPSPPDWAARLAAFNDAPDWAQAVALAQARLSHAATIMLDEAIRAAPPPDAPADAVRLAILSSCTVTHLVPAIRVAGLRRGLLVRVHACAFGQYMQELSGAASALHEFRPTHVLFALDAHHLCAGVTDAQDFAAAETILRDTAERIRAAWTQAREAFGCRIIQQTALPLHAPLLGNNEHRLPGSPARCVVRLNAMLRDMVEAEGADLLALDDRVAQDGIAAWHKPALWHHARQEISPGAAPLYGDLVARLLAASAGRSRKCLVLDLDNTLWGGVIGDDGLEGIVLGRGSALGDAFVDFQHYVRALMQRGVILAVCSKNDIANALTPFERHPEMVLRRGDIACFVANWSDKPSNIRAIAQELNIGLDALVFVDDNPFERALVRQELPMVAVPELPDDPAGYARVLADAGYFEALSVTAEDRERTQQYQGNKSRKALKQSITDVEAYLRSLEMRLLWQPFDRIGLSRIVQLIHRSNQFNLTTRRYSEAEIRAMMEDPTALGLQLRLLDRFGDNGMIAVVIGRLQACGDLLIDTWLMSCRVLGRQVEHATLNLIAGQAKAIGAQRLVGEFVPSGRNEMVRSHYQQLGFMPLSDDGSGGLRSVLDLAGFAPRPAPIQVERG